MPVADTLLRLAEEPCFFVLNWSEDILAEVHRTLLGMQYTIEQADRRIAVMKEAFPAAMVTGYQELIKAVKSHPKDRHVLAAAIRCGAHVIVSDNKKHFPAESLKPYELECLTTDEFLTHQYHLNPDLFITKLMEQAKDIGMSVPTY